MEYHDSHVWWDEIFVQPPKMRFMEVSFCKDRVLPIFWISPFFTHENYPQKLQEKVWNMRHDWYFPDKNKNPTQKVKPDGGILGQAWPDCFCLTMATIADHFWRAQTGGTIDCGFTRRGKSKDATLRIMGSQNWWFGDPRPLLYTSKPLYSWVQWFLGNRQLQATSVTRIDKESNFKLGSITPLDGHQCNFSFFLIYIHFI